MAQNVARLGVVLGIDTAEFTKGIGSATLAMSKFVEASKTQITVGLAGMSALIAKTTAYADHVTDLADANEMSVASVMALGSALAVSGGKAENAGRMLSSLTGKIDDVTQGVTDAEKPFQRLGISISEIASSSNEQLLRRVVDQLAKMEDVTKRNAIAADLFSKAGRNITWSQFQQELNSATERFKDSEEGIRAMADAADSLNIIWTTLMSSIAKGVGTDLKATVEYLDKIKGSLDFVGQAFSTVFETIVVVGANVIFVIERIAVATKLWFSSSNESAQANIDMWKKYNEESEKARKNLDEFQKKVLTNEPTKKSAGGEDEQKIKRQIELNSQQANMLAMAKLLSVEYERQQSFQLAQLAIRNNMLGMTNDERRVQEAINQVLQQTSQKIDDITKRREEAVGRKAGDAVIAEYDAQIVKINELKDKYVEGARIIEESSIQTQRTFIYGWDKAFNQFKEDAYNNAKIAEDIFKSITSSMNSAIDKFVETGKLSFEDFASSVIKSMIKIQLQAMAAQAVSGIGGLFSGFMGAGSTSSIMSGASGTGGFTGVGGASFTVAADGGMINAPTLVGENGPELFIPQRSGTVIPNQQMSSYGNDQPQVVYNGPYIAQMNAMDTQSATQFLSKNKMAIWSANQSASRSIPVSR
jgi:lambda family phage tail tape measure protein